jgi:hypothetical protein
MLIGKRAEDTTNACFGTKDRATTGALVKDDSNIRRHWLGFRKPALRAGDDGGIFDHGFSDAQVHKLQAVLLAAAAIEADLGFFQCH